jgi:uncharacterized protein
MRTLDRRSPYKPLDVGNGIVSGAITPGGRWLSLGIGHPVHGRVELTRMEPFAGSRFDQSEVRAYRESMADPTRPSFGFDLLDAEPSAVWLAEDSFPAAIVERAEGRFESIAVAPEGRSGVVQIVRIKAKTEIRGPTWTSTMRLARAEYTQLTAGGPLPDAHTHNRISMHQRDDWPDSLFLLEDRALGAAATIAATYAEIGAGTEAVAILVVALGLDPMATMTEAHELARDAQALVERQRSERRTLWTGLELDGPKADPVRRGLAYAIDCAASRSGDVNAILADHQILPLVWTRDAYYVCRALLGGPPEPRVVALVDGFIRWTFESAETIEGWWPRASLASGGAKDPAFQLDQQLWPLLLVADRARLTRDPSQRDRYAKSCASVIDRLLQARTPFGLVATAETPADDPLEQPFHFSSHVLFWRVLSAFERPDDAAAVRDATLRHFASDGRFAYAVAGPDGRNPRHYHDANDLPTVFAPGWGFCSADDPRWRATIDFAWSIANEGYFAGTLAGLGSLHTRHPWPLGDLQEIVLGRVMKDPGREQRARERLARVEMWDGMLPEAYDETSGAVASRHWFAWPAALRALLEREPMLAAP